MIWITLALPRVWLGTVWQVLMRLVIPPGSVQLCVGDQRGDLHYGVAVDTQAGQLQVDPDDLVIAVGDVGFVGLRVFPLRRCGCLVG